MERNLAVLAEGPAKQALPKAGFKPTRLQDAAAQIYAAGFLRNKAALELVRHFWGEQYITPRNLRKVRLKLKQWESVQGFRDLIYTYALQNLDLDSPHILKAVGDTAKRGRVDAAKFSLELTGRYAAKDTQATQVNVVFTGQVPRPKRGKADYEAAAEEVDE